MNMEGHSLYLGYGNSMQDVVFGHRQRVPFLDCSGVCQSILVLNAIETIPDSGAFLF